MNKIKEFSQIIWYYITFPFNWLITRKIDRKLTQIAEEDRRALLTEKDVEVLRSIGINTDLETLRNGGKKSEKKEK